MMYKSLGLTPGLFFWLSTSHASFVVYRDILLCMEKRNLIILISAVVIVLGIILATKYFDKLNMLKQENIEAPLVPQKFTSENISLPPPPATSTISKTIKLPKPLSSRQQQEEQKKITLPPPPIQ